MGQANGLLTVNISGSGVARLNRISLGCVPPPRRLYGNLSGFECYPCKVLPPHGAWVSEVNPAIIPAS